MPLNPRHAFNALLEGPLVANEDGLPALYEDGEELTYWDEGLAIDVQVGGAYVAGRVAWQDEREAYAIALPDGTVMPFQGLVARRRVGGSV